MKKTGSMPLAVVGTSRPRSVPEKISRRGFLLGVGALLLPYSKLHQYSKLYQTPGGVTPGTTLAGWVKNSGGWWDFVTCDLSVLSDLEVGYLAIYPGGLDEGWVADFYLSLAAKFPGPLKTWLPLVFKS